MVVRSGAFADDRRAMVCYCFGGGLDLEVSMFPPDILHVA